MNFRMTAFSFLLTRRKYIPVHSSQDAIHIPIHRYNSTEN